MAAAAPPRGASPAVVAALDSIFGDKSELEAADVVDWIVGQAAGSRARPGSPWGSAVAGPGSRGDFSKDDEQEFRALAVFLCEVTPGTASRDATQAFLECFCCSRAAPSLQMAAGMSKFREFAVGPRASFQGHVQPELVKAVVSVRNSGEARTHASAEEAAEALVDNPRRFTVTLNLSVSGWSLVLWRTTEEASSVVADAYVPACSLLQGSEAAASGASPWLRPGVSCTPVASEAGTLVCVATGRCVSVEELCASSTALGTPMSPCIRPSLAQRACFPARGGLSADALNRALLESPGNFVLREASDGSGLTAIYTNDSRTLAKLRFPAFPDSRRSHAFTSHAMRPPESMLDEPAAFLRSPDIFFPSSSSQPYPTLSRLMLALRKDAVLRTAMAGGASLELTAQSCATADEVIREDDLVRWTNTLRADTTPARVELPSYGPASGQGPLLEKRESESSEGSDGSAVHARPCDVSPAPEPAPGGAGGAGAGADAFTASAAGAGTSGAAGTVAAGASKGAAAGASGADAGASEHPADEESAGAAPSGGGLGLASKSAAEPDYSKILADATWDALGSGPSAQRCGMFSAVEVEMQRRQLSEQPPANYVEEADEALPTLLLAPAASGQSNPPRVPASAGTPAPSASQRYTEMGASISLQAPQDPLLVLRPAQPANQASGGGVLEATPFGGGDGSFAFPTSGPTAPGYGHAGPTAPGYGHAGPTAPGYGHADPTAPGYGHAGPTAPGYGHAGPTAPGYGHAGPTAPGYGHAGPTAPGYGHAGPTAPGYGHAGPTAPGYGHAGPTAPGYGHAGPTAPGYGHAGPTAPGYGHAGLLPPGQCDDDSARGQSTDWMLQVAMPLISRMDLQSLERLGAEVQKRIEACVEKSALRPSAGLASVFCAPPGSAPGADMPPASHLSQPPASLGLAATPDVELFQEESDDD
ncbi:hypothetical protein FNF27_02614 [Cafeteria roenbergensis]|uniref:Uncharacterized protein n=1 Tax=Cafeteria roenbergensis TaxID=33653 RepID=A0A5A8EDD7_CAFRO|nr:hypothetical protein FNF27_02614 [Cafeteria roenbergensis]